MGRTGRNSYDAAYRAARSRALPSLIRGTDCARCGEWVDAAMRADFDHLEDGTYAWSHSSCNRSAGGRIGGHMRAAQRAAAAPPRVRPCLVCGLPFEGSRADVATCGRMPCVKRLQVLRRQYQPDPEPPVIASGRRY
jgi:hypothetical protein